MADAIDIWDQKASLTLDRDAAAPGIVLPPFSTDRKKGPLRDILRTFLAAPAASRSLYSLQLENGQTYNAQDIEELLAREDCPISQGNDAGQGE